MPKELAVKLVMSYVGFLVAITMTWLGFNFERPDETDSFHKAWVWKVRTFRFYYPVFVFYFAISIVVHSVEAIRG